MLRLVTVIALLLTLPFFGIASIANARACHDERPAAAQPAHDCCPGDKNHTHDDGSTQTDGCTDCTAAHACKTPQPVHAGSLSVIDLEPLLEADVGTAFGRMPALSPDLPLRPPRS